MDRNKVLELALKVWGAAGGTVYIGPPMNQVSEFADLIEREVRGDAEPVAWRYKVIPPGWTYSEEEPSRDLLGDAWERIQAQPLYTHPQPAVVRQLVEALETLVGWEEAEAEHFDAEAPDDWIMDKARKALAAAEFGKQMGGSDES